MSHVMCYELVTEGSVINGAYLVDLVSWCNILLKLLFVRSLFLQEDLKISTEVRAGAVAVWLL